MLLFSVVKIVGSAMSVFGQQYATYAVGRFLMGMGGVGCGLTGYVIGNKNMHNICNNNNNNNNKSSL